VLAELILGSFRRSRPSVVLLLLFLNSKIARRTTIDPDHVTAGRGSCSTRSVMKRNGRRHIGASVQHAEE
jgi:hypothetical protein